MSPVATTQETPQPPTRRWRLVGPGLVVAATGVGAGDLVATTVAGSRYGYTLLWAAVVGCLIKVALAEATGRWHLSTGRTILDGWRTMGRWTTWYFGIYIVVWGFVYGATAMSASALPLVSLFPDGPSLKVWGILSGTAGLACVWFNRYAIVEKIMMVFTGIMFVVVVSLAIRVGPDVAAMGAGLWPTLPDGSVVYTLGLIGGVGGTITLASYGYWVTAKGWTTVRWMPMMRLDNRVAYATTGIFVIAMMVIGAELLHSAEVALTTGDRGLLDLGEVLDERFGSVTADFFLIGFFAASFSSVIGVWHGVSLLFADFVAHARPTLAGPQALAGDREHSLPFRAYLLWLTFPPMALLFLDQPIGLVITYGVLGSFFMPFLALTLLWLLNTGRTPLSWRNGWLSNVTLAASGVLFLILCVQQIRELPW
ncbi:Nramp family divalent metal transporter [Streptomyces sedi]|uniref:Divalent metal cation transporter n=1 Tax=Streptomyces sedi TaxID=555059 RepID=A0A5C4V7M5_9ACTN|nr:Nramp family divalent metal transporter [Streptomyces sedi]TNM31833.1 divalent metal cation transporter [Streptomyces sedi]